MFTYERLSILEKEILNHHNVKTRKELAEKTFEHIEKQGEILIAYPYSNSSRDYCGFGPFSQNQWFINKIICYGTTKSFLKFCDAVLRNDYDRHNVLNWKCDFLVII